MGTTGRLLKSADFQTASIKQCRLGGGGESFGREVGLTAAPTESTSDCPQGR